jgi:protease I
MQQQMSGRKILVLVSNGVDEAVMSNVQRELLKTGAAVKTVGTETGLVNSWNAATNGWGLYFPVDQQIGQTMGSDFDALIVPPGARSVQKLGANPHAERIISSFITAGKPMAFMGDAVELLAKTGLAQNWKVAGPERSHQVMVAAGASWQIDAADFVDGILMTGESADPLAWIQNALVHLASDTVEQKAAA